MRKGSRKAKKYVIFCPSLGRLHYTDDRDTMKYYRSRYTGWSLRSPWFMEKHPVYVWKRGNPFWTIYTWGPINPQNYRPGEPSRAVYTTDDRLVAIIRAVPRPEKINMKNYPKVDPEL